MNKGLLHKLPPISVDFSGACSILADWDVETLLLSPGSCGKLISQTDEFRLSAQFLETQFDDLDISRGIEEPLIAEILEKRCKAKSLVLLGTPVAAFLGTDYKRIVDAIENCITIPLNGFNTYKYGISEALLAVGRQLLSQGEQIERHINIVGYSPLNLANLHCLDEHVKLLEDLGFEASVLGTRAPAFGTALNWVVSMEGVKLAEWMAEQYEIPYIAGVPIGKVSTCKWLENIGMLLHKEVCQLQTSYRTNVKGSTVLQKKVVVIGEEFISQEIANCLKEDFAMDCVEVFTCRDEVKIEKATNWADVSICDNLIYDAFFQHSDIKFIPVPYMAIGGRTDNLNCNLLGHSGYNYFLNYLK